MLADTIETPRNTRRDSGGGGSKMTPRHERGGGGSPIPDPKSRANPRENGVTTHSGGGGPRSNGPLDVRDARQNAGGGGIRNDTPPKLKYTQFPLVEWADLTEQGKAELRALKILDEEQYNERRHDLCTFCRRCDHILALCPFLLCGSKTGIAKFGDLKCAERLVLHHNERLQRSLQINAVDSVCPVCDADPILWGDDIIVDTLKGNHGQLTALADANGDETFSDVYARLEPY